MMPLQPTTESEDHEGLLRTCRVCGELWPIEDFCKAYGCRYARTYECKACRNERRQANRHLQKALNDP